MNFWINLSIYLGIGVIVGIYWNIWIRGNSTNPEVDLKPLSLWGQTLLAGYLWPITIVRLIWR
jgi:hypothetical protein